MDRKRYMETWERTLIAESVRDGVSRRASFETTGDLTLLEYDPLVYMVEKGGSRGEWIHKNIGRVLVRNGWSRIARAYPWVIINQDSLRNNWMITG